LEARTFSRAIHPLIALGGAVVVVVVLAGCGSTDGPGSATTTDSVGAHAHPPATAIDRGRYVGRAEAICRNGLRETRALGRDLPEILASSSSPQEGITSHLVKPGTGILSREAAKLRHLRPVPNSRELEIYLGLFEPIVELAHQRLEAGTAGELEQARSLELTITSLEDEQSAAAHDFGLNACSVEFTRALGGSG
jgi:hypothetical protein